jgi:hypothetical protein
MNAKRLAHVFTSIIGSIIFVVAFMFLISSSTPSVRADTLASTGLGSWAIISNPGWSGDSHVWISSTEGWSFTPQPPWGIEFYRWNGTTWQLFQTLPKNGRSYIYGMDMQMVSPNDGWAVAPSTNQYYSTFFHWNGTQWTESQQISDTDIIALDMITSNSGWAVGNSSNVGTNYYHWDGNNWQKASYLAVQWPGSDIAMLSDTDGWSVGLGIARKTAGGWATFGSPVTETLNAIDMVNPSDGWIVGNNGTILRWTGGSVWSVFTSPTTNTLQAIEMVSSNDGWAVGNKGTILHWNGTTWSLVPSPVMADFTEIDMLSANEGYIPYYDSGSSSEGLLYYSNPASLAINYTNGAPGSFFAITGTNFIPSGTVTVVVNGRVLTRVDPIVKTRKWGELRCGWPFSSPEK